MSNPDLESKYGAAALQAGRRVQGEAFERRLAQRDSLDQHFVKVVVHFRGHHANDPRGRQLGDLHRAPPRWWGRTRWRAASARSKKRSGPRSTRR